MSLKRKREWFLILMNLLECIYFSYTLTSPIHIVRSFSDESGTEKFNNLIMDNMTGNLYIGAVNRLYHLTSDLELKATTITGPNDESAICVYNNNCRFPSDNKLIDNVNKVLLIDHYHNRLIECGSAFQGICRTRLLSNITIIEHMINEPVVANNASASTYAFIAPGPRPEQPTVMYVGVTFSGNVFTRTDVPAVASRSLKPNTLFQITRSTVTTGTRAVVNSYAKVIYPIRYAYGFSSQGFSYFLTNQLKDLNLNSNLISKVVRICEKDWDFYSYTEIPLQCSGRNGTSYNLIQTAYLGKTSFSLANSLDVSPNDPVLFAIFATNRSGGDDLFQPQRQSALCIYSLKSLRSKFTENIKQCFMGKGERGLSFFSQNIRCIETKIQINDSFCGLDVNTPLGGEIPAHSVAVLEWNTLLTSIATTSAFQYTVAFLGTVDGHLKKVVIETRDTGQEYADLVIDQNSPVNSDLVFDNFEQHIYVMTQRKISKVKVQDCSLYETCNSCLGTKDPYCGWCSLWNRCSLLTNCPDASIDELSWVSYNTSRCPNITYINPDRLQYTTARTLEMKIDNLPNKLSGQFQCIFTTPGTGPLTTDAKRADSNTIDSIFTCPTPRTDLLPPMQPDQHHYITVLSVRIKGGHDLVARNFTFFDCNTYGSCTKCVNSSFACDWCIDGHRCTHDAVENCRNDFQINGINKSSLKSGPLFCPRIEIATGESTVILIAAGSKKNISVKVDSVNLKSMTQMRFVCQFNLEGRVRQVNAVLLEHTIYCYEIEFSYNSPSPNVSVSFGVIWGGSKPLDNPHNFHIVVYRCREMANSCGMCLALPFKYGCGWCQSSSICKVKDQCEPGMWLNQTQICPNPEITDFEPKFGPWDGGTNVTIYGVNLGKEFKDIDGGILVAALPCAPIKETYVQTRQVTCKLDGPGEASSRKGPVVIKVGDYRGESRGSFTFVDPILNSVYPTFGPKSGGTKLTIRGQFMDAGSSVEAFVKISHSENLPCTISRRTRYETECITSAASTLSVGRVNMKFDNGHRIFNRTFFEYKDDPVILELESGPIGQPKIPKSIPAGGIRIAVTGRNFMTIQEPNIYIWYEKKMFQNGCQLIDDMHMICYSPKIDINPNEVFDADHPLNLDYGFIMDAVSSVHNLSSSGGLHPFLIYPDPIFEQFDDDIKHYKSDYLTINGRNLDRAMDETDVAVRIGAQFCNVTSLSRSQLTCRPPKKQPPALLSENTESYSYPPEVQVHIGSNLVYRIGKLSYNNPGLSDGLLPKSAIIGVIIGGIMLILIVIIILIAYKKKSKESSRVLKNMKEQMDVLELRVAAECKEAFAELQTEMTDLTGDLTSGGIPYLDYRSYTMKILFPNMENHPVLQPELHEIPHRQKGLYGFNQLILTKTFLLIFIRTLESNRYFCMRDRVNVASLIMTALQNRMEYCTDILKTLLSELIERYMDGRNHPKLLLRRTEYVAEKMLSAWFVFLLHKFVRECAGEPLYVLYRAIKQQVDKGPVDAVTGEARYSLSEEKLVRQSVNYVNLIVYVSMSKQTLFSSNLKDTHNETVDSPVRVLNCDTISQVKEKALDVIYRSTPFSQRPCKDDLDLEWRKGPNDRIVLYDEDNTSKIEDGMRRLNTLSHYQIMEGARFTLLSKPRPHIPSLLTFPNDRTLDHCPRYESLNVNFRGSGSPPVSRTISPFHTSQDNGGVRTWHLVRHHDHENQQRDGERGSKMVSEIYLTRLLSTKLTLQKFVDDLFETVFSTAHRGSALPLAIKYMFDFLDDQALQHSIVEPEVVHTWKSNALPLRFWVNLIKNPDFVFDIHKSNIVDACLSVVAQTFMDSCSTSDHRLGKDSPSSKLLYAKDIPKYREWVERYYRDIRAMPPISDQDMNAMLAEESRAHSNEFNTSAALLELYGYASRYNEQIHLALEEDEFARDKKLANKLEIVHSYMNVPPL